MGSFCNSRKSGPKCTPAKPHISPKWGAIPPEQKLFLSGSLGPKSTRVRWGKGAPQGGEIEKVPRPQNFRSPFSRKNCTRPYIQNFRDRRGPEYLSICKFKTKSQFTIFCKMKKQKFLLRGAWPPNLTSEPNVPRNLSRALCGTHDPEKISEIARAVAEKIEFQKKI